MITFKFLSNKYLAIFLLTSVVTIFTQCNKTNKGFNKEAERAQVEKTIHHVIGWAKEKDFDLFFNTISNDTSFMFLVGIRWLPVAQYRIRCRLRFFRYGLRRLFPSSNPLILCHLQKPPEDL